MLPLEMMALVIVGLMSLNEVKDLFLMLYHALCSEKTSTAQMCTEFLENMLDDVTLAVCWVIIILRYNFVTECAELYNKYAEMRPFAINLSEIVSDFEEVLVARELWFALWIVLFVLLAAELFRFFSFDPRMKVNTHQSQSGR